uniref:Ice-binding protein C-terminal domain-containing protein n=1 Tax=Solibacter usitatus (strain Ellin6076) TaxID=234267 RepID=Q01XH0_SOLUE
MRHGLLLPAILFMCLPVAASATTIFDNGAPVAACFPVCPELTTGTGTGIFTLTADTILTDIRFWTLQTPAPPSVYNGGNLTWQIFADNGGVQGALIASNSFKLSQTPGGQVSVSGLGLDQFENDFSVPNVTFHLSSPQSYFLDITDTSGKDAFGIFWAGSGENMLAFQLMGSGNNVTPDPSSPEPSTILLFAAGIAACVAARRLGLLVHRA